MNPRNPRRKIYDRKQLTKQAQKNRQISGPIRKKKLNIAQDIVKEIEKEDNDIEMADETEKEKAGEEEKSAKSENEPEEKEPKKKIERQKLDAKTLLYNRDKGLRKYYEVITNTEFKDKDVTKNLGKLIAESGNILVYGAESGYTSLSTEAAKEASKYNGITVGVAGGKNKNIFGDFRPTVLINSGQEIGGGREFNLVLSCDVIIAISGGSGTLTEMAIAYQAGIPIIVIDKFRAWASQLSNKYIDDRNRLKCISAKTEKEALELAIKEANNLTNK